MSESYITHEAQTRTQTRTKTPQKEDGARGDTAPNAEAHFRGREGRREAWARMHITTRSAHKSYLTRVERAITGDA